MRVLLVSPGFHGYWQSVQAALERRGHVVHTHVYDDAANLRRKLANKAAQLPKRAGLHGLGSGGEQTDATVRAVAALRATRPDAVVVIKGDLLDAPFWECLDHARLPRVLWLYDELRRLNYTPERLRLLGPVASYSVADVATLCNAGASSRHLPLAFDPSFGRRGSLGGPQPKVIFVGARYGQRERLLRALVTAGVPVKAYGRDWSHHPYDRLRTWSWRRPDVPDGRDLPRQEAYDAMASSLAALNIHGDQDGFTMRTFEACGVGALQLIDRDDLDGLYEAGLELAPFSTPEELVELCRRAEADPLWAGRLRDAGRRRTLSEHTFDARVQVLEELWCSN